MAASHPLAQTRYYTLLCFAYGGDPKTFADVVEKGYLPKRRAESCYFDYARIKHAVETLFQPHIDTAKAKQVQVRIFEAEKSTALTCSGRLAFFPPSILFSRRQE